MFMSFRYGLDNMREGEERKKIIIKIFIKWNLFDLIPFILSKQS